MFLLVASARQYPSPAGCAASDERSAIIVCSSSAFTPGCSEGSFRNQASQTATHTKPTAPNQTKIWRQDRNWSSHKHQRRGQAADEVSAREEDALGSAPLAPGYPAGEGPRDTAPRAGLTDAEEEPDGKQREVARGGAGGCGEARPPHDDARQHQARALAVGPPRGRNLEQRVRELEGSEDIPHLHGRQAEIPHDPGRQRRDACPVQVSNHRQAGGEGHDPVPHACGSRHVTSAC